MCNLIPLVLLTYWTYSDFNCTVRESKASWLVRVCLLQQTDSTVRERDKAKHNRYFSKQDLFELGKTLLWNWTDL